MAIVPGTLRRSRAMNHRIGACCGIPYDNDIPGLERGSAEIPLPVLNSLSESVRKLGTD